MQLTLIHTIKQITPHATNVQLVGTLNIVTKHLRIDYVPTDLLLECNKCGSVLKSFEQL